MERHLYSLRWTLFFLVSFTLSSCQKDLAIESEIVLIQKDIQISYIPIRNGTHTILLFKSEADLFEDENILQEKQIIINDDETIILRFKDLNVEEVFVKLRIGAIPNAASQLKYDKSIRIPNYNSIISVIIDTTEWMSI